MGDATTFSSAVLRIERDGHLATLWLDRPEARNAMGSAFFADLARAVIALEDDDQVRAIVVAAEGPHFSVGLDLKEVASGGGFGGGSPSSPAARAVALRKNVLRWQEALTALAHCPKPSVAAVHGYCLGGGIDLIAACDLRYCSDDAVFSVRETKVAIVADLGSLQRLPRLIGQGQVNELALTGKDFSASRAKEIGLVNETGPGREGALELARAAAAEIAANSPLAVAGTKAVLAANDGRTIAEGLDYVATWNASQLASDDLTEAMTAFMEKRPPNFTGR